MASTYHSFKAKLSGYTSTEAASKWFTENYQRIASLLDDDRIRDFVFEPISGVFRLQGQTRADEIRAAITRVAVVNAVLAGLPGKMGVGVFVSMALEAWMALAIAQRTGVKIDKPADIFQYFPILAAVGVTIVWVFKELLGVLFSLFSVIPGVNPLIPAELVATNLVGVLFWIGFEQAASSGKFKVPFHAYVRATTETKQLYLFQWSILKSALSLQNVKHMGSRAAAWLRGEIPRTHSAVRGELFPTVAMAYLIAGKFDSLEGPLAKEFVASIRDRFPELADAPIADIAKHMSEYDAVQLDGVTNLIKGKLFERMVVIHENADGDDWTAHMHSDEFYPGSDIVMTHSETGEQIEISLKATANPAYIETALRNYPDIPIIGPSELGPDFLGHPGFLPSNISHEEVLTVTNENFESLLGSLNQVDAVEVSAAGVAAGAAVGLWPFVAAYLQKRISYDQLVMAMERVYGSAGTALASRVSYAVILGPVFAWYMLARGVIVLTQAAEPKVRRLALSPAPLGSGDLTSDRHFYT